MDYLSLLLAPSSMNSSLARSWAALQSAVDGRLYQSIPFAQPCYQDFSSPECLAVRSAYLDEVTRTSTPTAFIQSQWETCQATNEHCLLDWKDPHNEQPTRSQCKMGSLPQYYIDVHTPRDVTAAFDFSRNTGIPLTIRNTGSYLDSLVSPSPSLSKHDYKGRSSAPGSLGVWPAGDILQSRVHPEGCSAETTSYAAVTMGAGVRWNEAHQFADKHNITLVGGSDKSVGAVGGWLQGGGHSALSNTMGLGADRVLQFKLVTPDGHARIANACQNPNLFWALRGGGAGTFGVVLEATVLASPAVALRTVILSWGSPDVNVSVVRTREAWRRFVDVSVRLAGEGWGGYVTKDVMVLVNPRPDLSPSRDGEGGSVVKELVDWVRRVKEQDGENGGRVVVVEKVFESWLAFFEVFTSRFVASVGKNLALASRLVPRQAFEKAESRSALVDALMDANTITTTPGLIILFTAPASTPDGALIPAMARSPSKVPFVVQEELPVAADESYERTTSVHPAWRESLYHVTVIEPWAWNATPEDMKGAYRKVRESLGPLKELLSSLTNSELKKGAAYVNEADVYEDDFEDTFWGDNYPRLLGIKRK
ncbi:hypothetical protein D9611_000989 [Ephemerocybe angulata]|uniref:FAD-binding PCMH-type domain-containing protein n=1 Tax=Ephemerocybe angulata TaxID=980116 RepID=A0A8H5F7L7_9AGAR|nr:hypothetical protein D9611_000989 [Tulosesus angulatus]